MKLWIKLYYEDRIVRHFVYEEDFSLTRENYEIAVRNLCSAMDIGCPLQLSGHYRHFTMYNCVKYLASEFVEECAFDKMWVENITQKKKTELPKGYVDD